MIRQLFVGPLPAMTTRTIEQIGSLFPTWQLDV